MSKIIYYSPYGGTILAVLERADPAYERRLLSSQGGQEDFLTATVTDAEAAKLEPGGKFVPKEG